MRIQCWNLELPVDFGGRQLYGGAIAWFGDTGKLAKLRAAAEPKEASVDAESPKK